MKNIKYLLVALIASCGLFTGCSSDDDWTSGPQAEGAQVYFSSEGVTTYKIEAATASVSVDVLRAAKEEEIEVPISATIADEYAGLFNIPETVTFAAGESKTSLVITFDRSKLDDGASYAIALAVDDPTMTTPYGASSLNITLTVPEPYVLLGEGLFRDDYMTSFNTSIEVQEYPCEIYENLNKPGYIYLKNVYTSLYPYNEPGDYVTEDKYFEVRISDPEKVLIPKQGLGMDWNPEEYGEFIIGTTEYGTLKDGVITFPVNGLLFAMAKYENGEWIDYANKNGMFRIVMPGAVLTDFSLEAAYDGFRVGADNTTAYPAVRVAYGADVASVKIVFIDGDHEKDYAETVAGIVDGSIESTEVPVSGEGEMEIISEKEMAAGVYTAVIVPCDAEGAAQAADAAAVSFYFPGVGAAETPACDIAVGVYPFSAVFPDYAATYPDSSTFLWIAQGSEIKTLKSLVMPTATIEKYLEQYSAEELVLGNGEDLADQVTDINEEGMCFAFYTDLPSSTSFTVILYAQNIYGNTATVSASGSTAAEAAAKAAAKLSTKNIPAYTPRFSKANEHYIYR